MSKIKMPALHYFIALNIITRHYQLTSFIIAYFVYRDISQLPLLFTEAHNSFKRRSSSVGHSRLA